MTSINNFYAPLQKFFAAIAILAMVFSAFPVTAVFANNNPNQGAGAIWTNTGPCGAPQNVNQYYVGQDFYIHGNNFAPNTQYEWSLKKPGNNGQVLKNGVLSSDGNGAFCENLFLITADLIGGPYQFNVGDSKNDNLKIDAATGKLTVEKVIVGNDAALESDFSFSVNGGAAVSFENDGKNELSINAGDYTVVEEAAPNYSTAYSNGCAGTMTNGGSKTCVITNTYIPPVLGCMDSDATNYKSTATQDDGSCLFPLTVVKTFGGQTSATKDQFSFTVNAGTPVVFEVDGDNELSVANGNYSVVEVAAPGFTPTYDGCANIVINGAGATCTITNTPVDQTKYGTLEIKKVVVGVNTPDYTTFSYSLNGGTAVAFDEDGVVSFAAPVGTHTVTEPAATGFTTTYEGCENLSITEGQKTICTITNTKVTTPILGCTDPDAENFNENATQDDGSCDYGSAPICEVGENLLKNGSFENPTVTNGSKWQQFNYLTDSIDWIVQKVSDSSDALLEFHRGWSGNVAADQEQYVELDGNQPTRISQNVVTEAGATYKLSWAFAPRQDTVAAENNLGIEVEGTQVDTEGPAAGVGTLALDDWTTGEYQFVANDTLTEIAFEDLGPESIGGGSDVGTFLDNAVLCYVRAAVPGCMDPDAENYNAKATIDNDSCVYDDGSPRYTIYGYVWHDENENDNWDGSEFDDENNEEQQIVEEESEDPLAGWEVVITNGTVTYYDETDEFGYYEFSVPAGTWTITETMQSNWSQTFPNSGSHVVVVPQLVTSADTETGILASIMSALIPTAHAVVAVPVTTYGAYNFGNVYTTPTTPTTPSSSSRGGNGRYVSLTSTPRGDVAGDSTDRPEGEVLGDSISVTPVGAPNTGAGGAAPYTATPMTLALLGMVASLVTLRVTRNG